jgi:hypothetical protein
MTMPIQSLVQNKTQQRFDKKNFKSKLTELIQAMYNFPNSRNTGLCVCDIDDIIGVFIDIYRDLRKMSF